MSVDGLKSHLDHLSSSRMGATDSPAPVDEWVTRRISTANLRTKFRDDIRTYTPQLFRRPWSDPDDGRSRSGGRDRYGSREAGPAGHAQLRRNLWRRCLPPRERWR